MQVSQHLGNLVILTCVKEGCLVVPVIWPRRKVKRKDFNWQINLWNMKLNFTDEKEEHWLSPNYMNSKTWLANTATLPHNCLGLVKYRSPVVTWFLVPTGDGNCPFETVTGRFHSPQLTVTPDPRKFIGDVILTFPKRFPFWNSK